MAKQESAISGTRFIWALSELLNFEAGNTRRVIIDARFDTEVTITIEQIGDQRLVKAIELLEGLREESGDNGSN